MAMTENPGSRALQTKKTLHFKYPKSSTRVKKQPVKSRTAGCPALDGENGIPLRTGQLSVSSLRANATEAFKTRVF